MHALNWGSSIESFGLSSVSILIILSSFTKTLRRHLPPQLWAGHPVLNILSARTKGLVLDSTEAITPDISPVFMLKPRAEVHLRKSLLERLNILFKLFKLQLKLYWNYNTIITKIIHQCLVSFYSFGFHMLQ